LSVAICLKLKSGCIDKIKMVWDFEKSSQEIKIISQEIISISPEITLSVER
jgi:hypothetical protein